MKRWSARTAAAAVPAAFPHITRDWTSAGVMRDVLTALVPIVIASVWYRGPRVLAVMLVSVGACLVAESLACALFHRPWSVPDGSAAVSGLLLALSLPAGVPLAAVAVGAAFSMLAVKALFGGIGRNFLNPALSARMLVVLLSPSAFVPASQPVSDLFLQFTRGDLSAGTAIGSSPALFLLLGGAFLYLRGVIRLTVPLSFLGVAAFLYWIFGGAYPLQGDAAAFILSHGILPAAFFYATDYTTSPATRAGRLVFGLGAGLLTAVFLLAGRTGMGPFEAILCMNAAAPLIERITQPRSGGTGGAVNEKP
ncbi:MAG: RnfABCDGE type electron transport complex subunit D [Clostridia bacterium]|nr:RnfABCDGE type electron transport complex subunit D [Clostridia bacterium]